MNFKKNFYTVTKYVPIKYVYYNQTVLKGVYSMKRKYFLFNKNDILMVIVIVTNVLSLCYIVQNFLVMIFGVLITGILFLGWVAYNRLTRYHKFIGYTRKLAEKTLWTTTVTINLNDIPKCPSTSMEIHPND